MMVMIAGATNAQAVLGPPVMGPALDAAGAAELADEITEHGRGANIYHALQHHKVAAARDFAAWVCLEKKCSRVRCNWGGGCWVTGYWVIYA